MIDPSFLTLEDILSIHEQEIQRAVNPTFENLKVLKLA
jgi:hypothetical protein